MRDDFPSIPGENFENENFEGKKPDWFVERIANLFAGDKAEAKELLKRHLRGGEIILDDGEAVTLADCYLLHRAAYQKREQFGHPHTLRMLETYLAGLQTRPGRTNRLPADLDWHDKHDGKKH